MLIPHGGTLAGATGLETPQRPANFLQFGPDDSATVPAEYVGPVFYNTTPAALVERAASLLTPEPMVVFKTPLRLSEARFGATPRAYIECSEDRAVPIELQRAMQARLPCDPVVTLKTDHSPFFSAPEELADALEAVAMA